MTPRLLIAGVSSGVGKTSLTLAIVRALRRRGLRVQTFKVGPDFLDPTYLAAASGRTCYNLDGWMAGPEHVARLFERATCDADLAIIEGVMGLFDGAEPDRLDGSSAEIASWLDAPVLLVASAHGAGRSLAAVARGFATFEPAVRVAGLIANRCGSPRHVEGLTRSVRAAAAPPLLGAVPRDALPTLQHRHLGLVTATPALLEEATLEPLADAAEKYLDLDGILALARSARAGQTTEHPGKRHEKKPADREGARAVRVGVARDAAFHFYYPDNLEALALAGAELVDFSPLADAGLPAGLDGLYFGGGYPELHAAALAANAPMRRDVRAFADGGGVVYAECGGLMYLGRSLRTLDGAEHAMAGVLPVRTRMLDRLRALGYVEAELEADGPWGRAGQTLRGHEFHYSEIVPDPVPAHWPPAYRLRRRAGGGTGEGFHKDNVLASYVHLHWAGRTDAADRFIRRCGSRT